jgi:hypothetical protein
MKSIEKCCLKIILVFSLFSFFEVNAQLQKVHPKFKTVLRWYWLEPGGKCVPVPFYDIISKVAPERIEKSNMPTEKLNCR